MGLAVRIFLCGPPAAGKTTMRESLSKWLVDNGLEVPLFGIEEQVREFCPKNGASNYYHYEDGRLVLLLPEEVVPRAWLALVETCRGNKSFIVEVADEDLLGSLLQFGTLMLRDALILHLTAPLSKRRERNLSRGDLRMPDYVVETFAALSKDDIALLVSKGATVATIDCSESIEAAFMDILSIVEKWLIEHSQLWDQCNEQ